MNKTKLGLSIGMVGAATYFLGLFSGYTVLVLLVGYILLCEEDLWLRKTAVKALIIPLIFSGLYYVIDLLPTFLGSISDLLGIFKVSFYPSSIYSFFNLLKDGSIFIKEVLMILLGLLALKQKTIPIGPIDKMMESEK